MIGRALMLFAFACQSSKVKPERSDVDSAALV